MSEEEKAIETLKEVASDDFDTLGDDISPKMAQNILNVISNQRKEIKKEKSRIMELTELLDKQENEINSLQQELEIQKGCSISKDKIRKIINKYVDIDEHLKYTNQELYGEDLKNMINELLEEK